ncbi:hypothetical protein LTR62_001121 [Meristemomyces frigidus]|uniref:Ribosome quality control complex subunit 2 n=1 Tax=Meristemomyces frigidus TaxID=1508187 RepID=A0AAN7THD6_9PEZI|nr:hypothetical protein LTR62_001121 [Meristemomyces frigidus]
MKQRFSSLDVRVIAHELSKSLVTLRLANIYDLSSRIFLLKFAKPDHREQLLIDSGFRCHLTSFARATASAPSAFVTRLRKFLRTRRVTKVQQIGTDRVLEMQFSDGQYRLFLEFYAGGNVVLTDVDLTILGLLRTVNEGEEHEQYRLGLKYDLSLRQNYAGIPDLTKERIRDGLHRAIARQQVEAQKPGKKVTKKGGDALRKALAVTTTEFPPVLLDHALYVTRFEKDLRPEQVVESEELLEKLLVSLQEAQNVVREITSAETTTGYILAKPQKGEQQSEPVKDGEEGQERSGLLYDDFHPFKPAQLAADPAITFLKYQGFNKTADEFFSSLEGQKLESRLHEREDNAKRKIEQARQEQAKRIEGLQSVQELNVRKAQAIEANVERVEEAVAAVNGLIAQGMDWIDIGHLISNEQNRHNAVAELIKLPLKLHENTITLLLSEYDDPTEEDDYVDETDSEASDSEDDTQTTKKPNTSKTEDKRLTVDIDLSLSPFSNARHYYDNRRTAAEKAERTAQASEKALKSTEQKVLADLKKGLKQEKDILRPVRKQMWFEKFIYFISSDGYLVLAGRDAQQNEILYRRYMKKGDVYIHADLHGAATVIVKNRIGMASSPIPPSTLGQAGNLAVCTSSAWESKAVMSAWWVDATQVSKTAPTGEFLSSGAFMIRGKKNFLPPAQLLLGFGLLWRVSEESVGRHVKNRVKDNGEDEKPAVSAGALVGDGDDDDDEFPDAHAVSGEANEGDQFHDAMPDHSGADEPDNDDEDDDDDDFPDAAIEADVASEHDEDHKPEHRANPLQSNGPASMKEQEDGEDEDDEDEDDEDNGELQNAEAASVAQYVQPNGSSAQTTEPAEPTQNGGKQAQQQPTKTKAAPKVRGKRGKAKKAAQKYADQDEEDRQLAMKLLGHTAEEEKAEAEASAPKTETAEEARARRRAQHQKEQKAGLEAEEIRRLNLEEGVEDLDEEESAQLTQLDSLVSTPMVGDEILECIPVCAPWTALAKYKFKVKMQPGQLKKGKAVREILGRWGKDASNKKFVDERSSDGEKIWPREGELLKGLKEVEVVGVVPVKSVRIAMGAPGEGKGKSSSGKAKRGGRGSKRK